MRVTQTSALGALIAAAAAAGAAGAQGIPPIQAEFANGALVEFYGQINKGILGYDDGVESKTYYVIDNDNSSTRFGLRYTQPFGDWEFQNVNEFEYAPYSTDNINVVDDTPSNQDYELSNDNIRKIDFTLENERFGKFWVGQGSMATDGVAQLDLSGTDVIGYSAVQDSASGQLVRYADDAFAAALGPEIGDVFTNYDGGRLVRVRYDTPSFSGFSVAFAYGQDLLSDDEDEREINQYDVALSYERELENFEVAAGFGYYGNDDGDSVWAGSASALHNPTGLNATFAAGLEEPDGGTEGVYWYGKLGLLREFVSWGDSGISVDYYAGDDILTDDSVELFDGDGNPVVDETGDPFVGEIRSSDSKSWGLALVQNVDAWNTEFWLTVRRYEYSDDFASYEDGQAIFGGARFSF